MRYLSAVLVSLVIFSLFGCASIFNGIGPESINVQSNPPGAKCEIRKADSESVIAAITTPGVVKLEKSDGFFRPAHYRVRCALENKEPREAQVNGRITKWWFGNIAIGGALGMALIDPATGGMWTLSPETVVIDYSDSSKSTAKEPSPSQASNPVKVEARPATAQPATAAVKEEAAARASDDAKGAARPLQAQPVSDQTTSLQ